MKLRICVVIPYYDSPRTLSEVVKGVVLNCDCPILIVDDASPTAAEDVLYSFEVKEALEANRLRVRRLTQQKGKGAVIQIAMQELVSLGYTHMLTMDATGQHLGQEVNKLIAQAMRNPFQLIVGRRTGTRGLLGRALQWIHANVLRLSTGMKVADPRSGFRLYPLLPMQTLSFVSNHSEFDWEALYRLHKNGVQILETEVSVDSASSVERRFHVADFGRAMLLHFSVILNALISSRNAPVTIGFAAAAGSFLGALPVVGFQFVLAVALSLLLRLNFFVLSLFMAGTGFFVANRLSQAGLSLGRGLFHVASYRGPMGNFAQMFSGTLFYALLWSAIMGCVAYQLACITRRSQVQLGRIGALLFQGATRLFGAQGAELAAAVLATWQYVFSAQGRNGLSEYYVVLAPKLTLAQRQLQVWRHLKRHLLSMGRSEHAALPSRGGEVLLSVHVSSNMNLPQQKFLDRPNPSQAAILPFFNKLALWDVQWIEQAAEKNMDLRMVLPGPTSYRVAANSAGAEQIMAEYLSHLEQALRKQPESWQNLYPFWSQIPEEKVGSVALESSRPTRLKPDMTTR
jgi:hypothetical protein